MRGFLVYWVTYFNHMGICLACGITSVWGPGASPIQLLAPTADPPGTFNIKWPCQDGFGHRGRGEELCRQWLNSESKEFFLEKANGQAKVGVDKPPQVRRRLCHTPFFFVVKHKGGN